ncbi:spore germination protein [Inconstantimicrobium mannanitabidum]|uniref:Spore germination protein n=1 Tax=Inconstantimicrobium mannanitabidum TaxID=1604901 RepID=A0ACB5RF62_9CLOT|nr:spore germination protein [Clostridium sp. TW13]GKX67796.1 spore germination protein [Clostridium sp. TW13]
MNNNLENLKNRLKDSFDVKYREVQTPLGPATVAFTDDLCSTDIMSQYIIAPLIEKNPDIKTLDDIIKKSLKINNVGYSKDLEDSIFHVLSGDVAIFFDNFSEVIYCEAKGFVKRGVGEPSVESVLKGPREGFTESIVDNVALIRKKAKNSELKFEVVKSGEESQTALCMSYIQGTAPKKLVDSIRKKLNDMDYRFILDTNYVEDKIKNTSSLFDTVGYSEKPDEVVSKLMEGRIAIIVDGTPSVLTVPHFFMETFQAPDDYYLNRRFANFSRILRWIGLFLAIFLPAAYVAFITYHFSLIPSLFVFRLAVARAGVPFPTYIEVILVMLFFQLIKEAGLRLPKPIGAAMSIVSGLILGDTAVKAGIASTITILVVAISTLSYFLIPKIYGAISYWSMIMVVFSTALGLPGFFMGQMVFLAHIASLETAEYNYLYPLGTVEEHKFNDIIFRGKLDEISSPIIKSQGDNK